MKYSKFMRALRKWGRATFAFDRVLTILQVRLERMREKNHKLQDEVEKLRHHIKFDPLTGILSRVGFTHEWDRFASEIARRHLQTGALLFIDLNGFKLVNDHLGHCEGDHILEKVAKAIERELRPNDSVARLGGDEFVVLLPGATLMGTSIVISRLHAAVCALCMEREEFKMLAQMMGQDHVLDFSVGMFFLEFGYSAPSLNEALALAESNMPKMIERRYLFRKQGNDG
jgi:diguanylate cyclase (GGDEF)-like protein